MGDAAKGSHDFTTESGVFVADFDRDFAGEVAVVADDGNVEWDILGEVAIKVHVAVDAYAADDSVANTGVFPKWVAELTDFLVL